jgi:hypothetical protein
MTRYDFTGWVGANLPGSIGNQAIEIMDGDRTVTATYQASFYLNLTTDPPEVLTIDPNALTGAGWQVSGSYATMDAKQTIISGLFRYDFVEWLGADFPGQSGNQAVCFMDAPHTVTALYQKTVAVQ